MSYQESSSFQSSFSETDLGGNAYGLNVDGGVGNYTGYGAVLNSLGGGAAANYSGYESVSSAGYDAGLGGALLAGNQNIGSEYYSSSSYGGLGAGAQTSSSSFETGFGQQSVSSTTYATDAQGLFQDANPQIIRRPAPGGTKTLTQRVAVRFLQPPPVPPPGPLIIKEVRPPQPPAPPPLYIRQRPPPPPVLPPVVIREAPPKMPPAVATQVITKVLPALPVPPRSVIIERLPPLPPKPRDIVVERWLPYRAQQKRRVIVQRAPPPVIQKPHNIIIYYEAPKAQVVRRFENLGIQRANPAEYIARYGAQLEDSQSLLTHARQAGVIEDISPPAGASSTFQSSSYEAYQSGGFGADAVAASATGYDVSGGLSGFADGGVGGVSSSSYESSSYSTAGGAADGYNAGLQPAFGGYNLVDNTNNVAGTSSSYESYATQQTYSQ